VKDLFRTLAFLESFDCVFQQAAVKSKPYTGNLAMLLCPEKVPRAADLKVPHGNLEASAKFRKIADGLKAFLRDFRQGLILFIKKIRIGKARRASHPSSHLIKLGKAKVFGPIDDDCIGKGHIKSILDDGR